MGDEERGRGRDEGPALKRASMKARRGRHERPGAHAGGHEGRCAGAGRYGSALAGRIDVGAMPNVYRDRNVGI